MWLLQRRCAEQTQTVVHYMSQVHTRDSLSQDHVHEVRHFHCWDAAGWRFRRNAACVRARWDAGSWVLDKACRRSATSKLRRADPGPQQPGGADVSQGCFPGWRALPFGAPLTLSYPKVAPGRPGLAVTGKRRLVSGALRTPGPVEDWTLKVPGCHVRDTKESAVASLP